MNRLVLIDGNAIIHRAYHAIPPMTTKDGTSVQAVFGFASMLLKIITDLKPTHMVTAFDVAGGTFRNDLAESYKATRVKADQDLYDQIPLVYSLVESFGISIVTKKGFEADDVIGTLVRKCSAQNKECEIVIVTGDKDLLQLVGGNVKVYLLRKGMSDTLLCGDDEVVDIYGFEPQFVPDYKALAGDTSDNIKGIKGVGDKTAIELIKEFGSIEQMYEHLDQLKELVKPAMYTKIAEGKADAELSKQLATIHTDVPDVECELGACAVSFQADTVVETLQKFEFFSLIKRARAALGETSKHQDINTKKSKKEVIGVVSVKTEKEFGVLVKEIEEVKRFVCRIVGETIYIGVEKGDTCAIYNLQLLITNCQSLFSNKDLTLIGHDIKQMMHILSTKGVTVQNTLFDVMIASYVLNSSTRSHDLASLMMRELGSEATAAAIVQGDLFGAEASEDHTQEVSALMQLYTLYNEQLTPADQVVFADIEMALLPVLKTMEENGIVVDTEMMSMLSKRVAGEIEAVSKTIWKEAGIEFNISSSTQLRDVLFDTLALPTQGIKKGKTGYSTASSELDKLRELHPIIESIEEYRELEKLRNTYIDVLPTLVKSDGRIHTTFNQAVASTGRLSSTDPNMQNIPIRTELGREIRNAFIAAPGYSLIAADYSQIELRVVASLAQDETLIGIFERGEDVHAATAAVINGVKLEDVTKEMRRAAKAVNFGVLYGQGAFGLARGTGLTQWEAKQFIETYFQKFSGVKRYLDETLVFARQNGYVETLFGRRRYVPELASDNFQLRNAGERMAINMPVQGTAADIMKLAMIALSKSIEQRAKNNADDVKMILQVHDELVLEVKEGMEEEVSKLVKETMQNVTKLKVPIDVEVGFGKRWGEIK